MSENDLIEHYRNVSEHLFAQYRLSRAYKNRSGKGDIREDNLISCLKEILPELIGLTKGEVVDSSGRKSPEFDIVMYLRNSGIFRSYSTPNRKVIPIEEILAVVEVKSFLKKEHISTFLKSLETIGSYDRFYDETETYQTINKILGGKSDIFSTPVPANQSRRGIGRIRGFIFAYESSDIATLNGYLSDFESKNSPISILVLNKALWVPDIEANNWDLFIGEDSFMLFLNILLRVCEQSQRWTHVVPNYKEYFENAARAADIAKKSKDI